MFVSGCRNHCRGCFQPETWDFKYGEKYTETTEEKIIKSLSRPYIRGLTLLGGEPFEPEHQKTLIRLLGRVKTLYPGKDVWCYTGFTWEELQEKKGRLTHTDTEEMLSFTDVLVDGRYKEDLKDLSLKFRGSSNQRIIDVKKSIELKKLTLWEQ